MPNQCIHKKAYERFGKGDGLTVCECKECFTIVSEYDNNPRPITTKQLIHEEFDREFPKNEFWGNMIKSGHTKLIINRLEARKIQSFYDAQIQRLLREVVPKEKECEVEGGCHGECGCIERNKIIAQIKENIKKAGY